MFIELTYQNDKEKFYQNMNKIHAFESYETLKCTILYFGSKTEKEVHVLETTEEIMQKIKEAQVNVK